MKNFVLGREVDYKIFSSLSSDEVKKYYEANRDKFRKPESITLSEIFLSTAGKSEADVSTRAASLVAQARGGADFAALAVANSEREQDGVRVAQQTKGKIGTFRISDISREDVAAAIKDLKTGGISNPIRADDGFIILHVDERTSAGEPTFNENQVREAMATERAVKEREDYLSSLRKDAYINIAKDYRDAVQPLLKLNAETTSSKTPAATAKTSTDKKSAEKKSDAHGNKKQ
jgi:parvulin-like peptidyl-prolyl isomerase